GRRRTVVRGPAAPAAELAAALREARAGRHRSEECPAGRPELRAGAREVRDPAVQPASKEEPRARQDRGRH
ncbi:hypothetical protein, partial [Bradyrhizobium sp.]|uniref:hypothetical protein n=1 Tax=Bradyrhizobium sp. TaxID=376 RepID=UPI00391AF1CD